MLPQALIARVNIDGEKSIQWTCRMPYSALPVALAQNQTISRHVGETVSGDEQEFVVDCELAVSAMSLEMSVDPTGITK
jgi:hypothetical protein